MQNKQNNSLATVSQLAKMDYKQVAETIANNILEGNVNPLEISLFLKKVEKITDLLKDNKDIKASILNEANKHGDKSFPFMGVTMANTSVHTSYDFSTCGDPVWDSLNEVFKTVSELKKEREAFLKNAFPEKTSLFGITSPTVVVDNTFKLDIITSGEVVSLNPPKKLQQMGLKITFPRK